MKRAVFALLVGLLVGSGINVVWVDAQGPLTPAANLRVRTDSNGYLLIAPATYTASDGPLTAFGNIRLRTDSNGYLLTAMGATGGTVQLADGTALLPGLSYASQPSTGLWKPSSGTIRFSSSGTSFVELGSFGIDLDITGRIGWRNAALDSGGTDLSLFRDAANTLAQRNGTNAQLFRVYTTYTDASNYKGVAVGTFGGNQGIIAAGAGTGANPSLYLGANGTGKILIDAPFTFTDNTYDIGATAATRPKNYWGAGSILSQGATAGVGYGVGAGGAITQITSRTTGVTLSTVTGDITLVSAAGSATAASFVVTNTAVAVTDNVVINQKSGTDLYNILITNVGAGSFKVTFFTTGGTTTEQPVFHFSVIKGVSS